MSLDIWYKNVLRNPAEIAALFPCSTETGMLMTAHLEGMDEGYVLELGSGTGALTECILQRQIPEEKLILIDKNKDFANYLGQKYKDANVITGDALDAFDLLQKMQIYEVTHIVCSLPLIIMPQEHQLAVLDAAFKILQPQGCFSTVTYFVRCPISQKILDQYNKRSELFGFTWKNLPPAYIYQIKEKQNTGSSN